MDPGEYMMRDITMSRLLTSRTYFIQLTTTEGYAVHKEEKINMYLPNRRIGTTWINLS